MANLSKIMAILLEQVARAQAASDARWLELQSEHEQDPLAHALLPPRPVIRELSVEMKFALRSVESTGEQKSELPSGASPSGITGEMDLLLTAEELSSIAPEKINSLTLTLGADELEEATSEPGGGAE